MSETSTDYETKRKLKVRNRWKKFRVRVETVEKKLDRGTNQLKEI